GARREGWMWGWQEGDGGFGRWGWRWSRTVVGWSLAALSSRAGTLAGGGNGGVFSRFEMTYFPRSTGDVRFATAVNDSRLPWPSKPRRFGSVTVTRRN